MIDERTERPPFGALLRSLRIAARLSQEQLAERARISVQAVSSLERGARRSPRADTLALLIKTLGLEGEELEAFEASARASVPTKVRRNTASREADREQRNGLRLSLRRPFADTSFIGRESEMRDIAQTLATSRCVTLWGPGGVGKTRLAIESLSSLAPAFADRIAFVALAPMTDFDSVVRAVAAAYDLVDADVPALLAHLSKRFDGSRTLLVLDNCEHVIEDVARVATSALARLCDLSILATSREPLRIDGERVVRIETLAVPTEQTVAADSASPDAVRLFLDRAASASGKPVAAGADLDSVATICRRLDGLPLAVELAAARTRSMSNRQIELALDERFSLLTRGNRSLDPRQQTLRDTIAWSYNLLERSRRIVFERLALLNGPFATEHAVAIAVDATIDRWTVLDALADLVDKALVGFASELEDDEHSRPYAMLESTRMYATALTDEERADRDTSGAWYRFGAWLLERAAESHDSFTRQSELAQDAISLDHLRGYLRFAIDARGDVANAATVVGTLMHWWNAQALMEEGLRWTEAASAALDEEELQNLRARTILLFGKTALLRTGGFQREAGVSAFAAHACALELAASGDPDRRIVARTAFMAAESAAILGRQEEAEALIGSAIEIYEALGDEHGIAVAMTQAGAIALFVDDYGRAKTCYSEAIAYFDRHGYRRLAAHARANLAEVDYALGNVRAAVDGARSAADVALELSSSYYIANTLTNLAAYLPDIGAVDEAADVAGRGLEVAREAGFDTLAARLYLSCATVAVLRGRDAADAAALFAYASPRVGDALSFTEIRLRDRLDALLREGLSVDGLSAAFGRGAELTEDEAFSIARGTLTA